MNRRVFWMFITMSIFLMACSSNTGATPATIIGNTEWHLTQLNGTAITTPVVTLQLTDTTIGGQGFCNSYHAPLTVTGNTLKLENIASTRKMCVEDGVMQQEQAYFAALTAATHAALNGTQLQLLDANNAVVLVFAK